MKRSYKLFSFGVAALSCGVAAPALAATDSTEFSVTVNPYLNVTLSSADVHLPITPSSAGTYDDASFTATSSTNSAYGYKLNLSIKDTNTAAAQLTTNLTSDTININDGSTPVIPTFSTNDVLTSTQFSASTSTDHINHWAMSLNDTDHYKKVLSESTIATSDGPIADDVTTLNLATKLDLLTPPGSYAAYFNFEIVANVDNSTPPGTTGGSIDESGGDNAGRVFPANSLLRAFELAYVNADKPIYVETDDLVTYPIGWRPMTDADQTTIGGKEVRFAIQDIALTFTEDDISHGVCEWARTSSVDNTYMDTALVMDLRDGTSYNIIKAADGRCWTQDNLALDLTDAGVKSRLSSSNTNATDVALNALKNGGGLNTDRYATSGVTSWGSPISYSVPWIFTANKDRTRADIDNVADPLVEANNWKFGVYYNYCAISAGSYCYGDGTQYRVNDISTHDIEGSAIDSEYDICPYGWRLPTGYDGGQQTAHVGEYSNMFFSYTEGEYISGSSDPHYAILRNALHLSLPGTYGHDSSTSSEYAYREGSEAYYPSSTKYSDQLMRDLFVVAGYYAYPDDSNDWRQFGYTVRCIDKNNP